jgi:NTP pyrophosphatase (non-canonical NTP hydrolase)
MNLNEYQEKALKTAMYAQNESGLIYTTVALCGEAGEVADKVKKIMRGDKKLNITTKADLMLELGDCLWYIAAMAKELGYSLDKVAQTNLQKLNTRYKNKTIQGDGDHR